MQCLKDILEVPNQAPVYLIVDGLDECSNASDMPSPREKVLTLFKRLVGFNLPNLRLCVTSRPEIDIKVTLEPLTFRSVSLHDESEQREDIDNYIRSVVNTDPKMERWKANDKELVIDVLIKNSDGM
jgi:Holliday junction resolvase RusA-like endonuclease